MFWRFGGYANISTLDSILDKSDVSLEELLDESDLIQELKQQNSKLIEFLRDEDRLHKLLTYVVADKPLEDEGGGGESDKDASPEGERSSGGISFFGKGKGRSRSKSVSKKDADGETEQDRREAQRKKYAYIACEVLSSEVWSITEAILENGEHLRRFWEYMREPAPLDPLQAGYFTKVNEALLDKKTEDMLAFFKSLNGIVPEMLKHVDCPMVMDLLLKIISLEKQEGGAGIVDWLQQQNLIPLLLGYLSPEHNSATQTSAGDFLKAIITISANATTQDQSVIGPNELTRQLVSDECISQLIGEMLRGGNPLTVGVGIIIEVIRKNNSDYDLDNQVGPEPKTSDPIYLGTLLRQFAKHIPDFMDLIRSPRAKRAGLKVAFGKTVEPLGFDRFKTCELMAELLHCSNMGLLNERGSEDEVRRRDSERERLKAEGKLATPRAPASPSHDEFGSSVDSHGFHHAHKPSNDELEEPGEEVKRPLEVANASDEDGFEKVQAEELPDEVSFEDVNEKVDKPDLHALEGTATGNSPGLKNATNSDVKPLSPIKPTSPTRTQLLHFDPPPTRAADSPTSAGVTDRLSGLDMDNDTVMTEFGEEPEDNEGKRSFFVTQQSLSHETRSESLHNEEQPLSDPAEDEDDVSYDPAKDPNAQAHAQTQAEELMKPAPLSVRKETPSSDLMDPIHGATSREVEDIDQSLATIQGEDVLAAEGTAPPAERAPYETEEDGTPVVGDLLKIMFVEHQVVPTILDFFFRFPWNNFLHNVVYDVVQQVFNGTLDRGYNKTLAFDLFTPAQPPEGAAVETFGLASMKDITERILDGQKASDISQREKGMRLGYMGHLTLIAEEVCKFGSRHPPEILEEVIVERVAREEWVQYVEGTLTETRDKDNAVLGGVRPENAAGARQMGMAGGGMQSSFGTGNSSGLSNAGLGGGVPQDTLALQEGTVGRSFEINSGTMLSGFGDGDDEDEDMDDAEEKDGGRRGSGGQISDDEQNSPTATTTGPSIPPPLNIPPSRARRQLAARLAQRKREAEAAEQDPDAADYAALETASHLPAEPTAIDLGPAADREMREAGMGGLQISGIRGLSPTGGEAGGPNKFNGLFSSSESSSSSVSDGSSSSNGEEDATRPDTQDTTDDVEEDTLEHRRSSHEREERKKRRPSTTEAKTRSPLDEDDDGDLANPVDSRLHLRDRHRESEGPFADPIDDDEDDDDSSDEDDDDVVEIRPRRTS